MMSENQMIYICGEGPFNCVGEGTCPTCGRFADLYDGAVLFLCKNCLEESVLEELLGPYNPSEAL